MKKNHFRLLLVVVFMIISCFVNIFVTDIKLFTESNLNHIILLAFILGFSIFVMGIEKNRSIYQTDVLQIEFIYIVIYWLAIYIFGFFFGFVKSPYSLTLMKIFQNTLPVIIIIILQELVRYQFTSKGKDKRILLILITFIFIAFEISIGYKSFTYNGPTSLYEFFGTIVIASISRNILLTYISGKVGYKATIMYRFLFEIIIFVVPFWPDLGLYLETLLSVIFPVVLFLKLNTFLANFKPIPRSARVKKLKKFFVMAPIYAFIIIVFIVVSGLFKIYAVAIVSDSMYPSFGRGDVVIVEKLNGQEIEDLEVGEILAYYYNGRVITHRIYSIEEKGKSKVFLTYGDNNNGEIDNWEVTASMIKGKIRFMIPIIGYPSVWLSELLN